MPKNSGQANTQLLCTLTGSETVNARAKSDV